MVSLFRNLYTADKNVRNVRITGNIGRMKKDCGKGGQHKRLP